MCVAFTKRRFHPREGGFANAVLRNLTGETPNVYFDLIEREAKELEKLNLGKSLYKSWAKRFDSDELKKMSDILQQQAGLTVRERIFPTAPNDVPNYFQQFALDEFAPFSLYHCLRPSEFFQSKSFHNHSFYVQDPSTLKAPLLLDPKPGETVADLCCAPGGKSLVMAELMRNKGRLVCSDRSEKRLDRVRENLRDFSFAEIVCADATKPFLFKEQLDAVLLDVPCSNTGVIRRRPDVRYRYSAKSVQEIVALQRAILENACGLVKPGGRLVYSTCSIEPEENQNQIKQFLASYPSFKLVEDHLMLPNETRDGGYAALLKC